MNKIIVATIFGSSIFLFMGCQKIDIQITNPTFNSTVDRIIEVSGLVSGEYTGKIHIYVYAPTANTWFYQSSASVIDRGFSSQAWVGSEDSSGASFKICAIAGNFDPLSYKEIANLSSLPIISISKEISIIRK